MRTPVTSSSRFRALRLNGLSLMLLGFLAATGCKQGEGEYCQVSSDCEDDLVCVPGIAVCQKSGGGGGVPDAAPRVDANTTDANTTDAAVLDADVSDADVSDAAVSDAAVSDADLDVPDAEPSM